MRPSGPPEAALESNLFMLCRRVERSAFAPLPAPFSWTLCRPEDLPAWRALTWDGRGDPAAHHREMAAYFDAVYAPRQADFFASCLLVRDGEGRAVGTGLLWRAYGRLLTLHWLQVAPAWEGRGLGRAILTRLLSVPAQTGEAVFLHTQPASFRAIKLYTDFGFALLTGGPVGRRENQLDAALPLLRARMPQAAYARLHFAPAPPELLEAAASGSHSEF